MKKIGIIVADGDEFKPLADTITGGEYSGELFLKKRILKFKISDDTEVFAMLCGIGKVNAAASAAHLVDIGCDIILNYGLSGGISGVKRGDICVCDRFLEHDFDLTTIGYKPCEKPGQAYIYEADSRLLKLIKDMLPGIKQGTAATGDRFVCDASLRDFLKNEFNAMSCDMETAAVAYVCEYAGVPFAAVRKISDDAGADAADSYREMNSSGETVLSDFILECARAAAELLL